MMKKNGFSQIAGCKRRHRAAVKAEKWNLPLVEKQRIWYNILHDAPSPSGKAGDFDSPIVGSTPAGATEDRLLKETFGRRSLCFAAVSGAAEHFAGRGAVLRKNKALREGCARCLCGVSF